MGYDYFDVEDFASDEHFQKWALNPDPETENFWQNWLAQHPEKESELKKALWMVRNISFDESWTSKEKSAMWASILSSQEDKDLIGHVAPLWKRLSWFAAASVLLAAVLFSVYHFKYRAMEVRTAYGEMRDVKLADGSVVKLNANSALRYKRNFLSKQAREIWIEGEAFFEIARREVEGKRVAFIVHADNLDVQVLGTAFNVNNRHGNVDVVLEHGSVKVTDTENAEAEVFMKPGEKVSQEAAEKKLVSQRVEIKEYTSWREHIILFKHKSLSEIAVMIKDMYDIDVTIDNPKLADETFTGSFPSDSVEVFFDKLEKMYPLEITHEGRHYHLK